AKAIAGEAERPFFSISGSDFVEMFVGVGASRVRDLFKSARENAPCIVFVDEIDAVGRKRGSGVGGGHDEREQTLNAILVEMDGIGTEDGIIVVAATNRPDVLDPALLRPGRFDRQVAIDLPDTKGREEIFKVHLSKVKVDDAADVAELGRATPGFSGADIANLINEAALATVLNGRDIVQMADLLEARNKVRFCREKKSRAMDEEERKITAYHEAGHTVVQHLTKQTDPVHKVTIIPRGMALGATMSLPKKDRYSLSIERAKQELMVLYGGRIAEELFCDSITTGASNDIERATDLATNMVVRYGFSEKLGPLNFAESEERDFLGGGLTRVKSHSNHTSRMIDEEIRVLIDGSYAEAKRIIESNRDKLEALAEALLRFETLDAKDVEWIMDGKSIEDKRDDDENKRQRKEAARRLQESENAAKALREDTPPELPSTGPEPSPA
ncbi:MAG: ATP-dependent zinc metalloprotease FtsH, partial [Planctomycetes bacterium]|nr:ATP-dependent zinc metalloprotease FtsH [Planctomycetota bacterium]